MEEEAVDTLDVVDSMEEEGDQQSLKQKPPLTPRLIPTCCMEEDIMDMARILWISLWCILLGKISSHNNNKKKHQRNAKIYYKILRMKKLIINNDLRNLTGHVSAPQSGNISC